MILEKETASPLALGPVDRAITDISDAIRASLEGSNVNKFVEASRLCQIGHQLQKARASTLEEFAALGKVVPPPMAVNHNANIYAVGGGGVVGYNVVNGIGGGGGGGGDMAPIRRLHGDIGQADVDIAEANAGNEMMNNPFNRGAGDGADYMNANPAVRKAMLAVEPALQVQRVANAAAAAESEAAELKDLLEIRDKLPEASRGAIDARVDVLVASVETRNLAGNQKKLAIATDKKEEKKDAEPALVPPDLSRGSAPRKEDGTVDDPPRVRADGDGGEGARDPEEARVPLALPG